MQLGRLSKRAQAAIAAAQLRNLDDFVHDDAAERLLAVRGCGRRAIREISTAVIDATGKPLGGFEQVMTGHSIKPTFTAQEAAKRAGVDVDTFIRLAIEVGTMPKNRHDGRIWSEWSIFSVRRLMWSRQRAR